MRTENQQQLPTILRLILTLNDKQDGTDREFRNVGYQRYMDAGDLPKRQQITMLETLLLRASLIPISHCYVCIQRVSGVWQKSHDKIHNVEHYVALQHGVPVRQNEALPLLNSYRTSNISHRQVRVWLCYVYYSICNVIPTVAVSSC